MFLKLLIAAARAGRRAVPSLVLAIVLLTPALAGTGPAIADEPITRDHRNGDAPVGRIQIVLKSVEILNDRDGGSGAMELTFILTCFATPTPCEGNPAASYDGYQRRFDASSGQTVVLDQVLPRGTPTNPGYDASVEGGYPVRKGQTYEVKFMMKERDTFSDDDDMGKREIVLTEANGWGTAQGAYDLQSVQGDHFGDFKVQFEIRNVTLPDLKPVAIKITDQPGTDKQKVCMTVHNGGTGPAHAFQVVLRVDGAIPADGGTTVPQLTEGGYTDACVQTRLPKTGQHALAALIDVPNDVLELNEANNVSEQAYTAPAKQTTTTTQSGPTPSGAEQSGPTADADQPDLTVRAIKINGQAPDGKRDCKDGKNDISVTVRNVGDGDAESFTVRLVVDGANNDALEQTVTGLKAGQEREVRFDDARLKKGERKLTATVELKGSATESSADNNTLKITAGCDAG